MRKRQALITAKETPMRRFRRWWSVKTRSFAVSAPTAGEASKPDPCDSRSSELDARLVRNVLGVIKYCQLVGVIECTNCLIEHKTGLDAKTVENVLDYLWKEELIDGLPVPSEERCPCLIGIQRMPNRWDQSSSWGRHPSRQRK